MLEKIYFLVATCDTWLQKDPNGYLQNYFVQENAFTNAILIALIIAVVGIAVFYGWIGMAVNKLANLTTWVITLLLTAVATFVVTHLAVIGSQSGQSGVFDCIVRYRADVLQPRIAEGDDQRLKELTDQTQTLVDTLSSFCDAVIWLHVTNIILAVVFFVALSFAVKGLTIHNKYIPV